jgi:hypothetical protein
MLLGERREGESLDRLSIEVADLAEAARPWRTRVFGQGEGTRIQDDSSAVRIGTDDSGQYANGNVASITAPEMELNEIKEDIVSRSYFSHTGEVLGVDAGWSGADRDLGTGNACFAEPLGKRDGDRALLKRNPTDLLDARRVVGMTGVTHDTPKVEGGGVMQLPSESESTLRVGLNASSSVTAVDLQEDRNGRVVGTTS